MDKKISGPNFRDSKWEMVILKRFFWDYIFELREPTFSFFWGLNLNGRVRLERQGEESHIKASMFFKNLSEPVACRQWSHPHSLKDYISTRMWNKMNFNSIHQREEPSLLTVTLKGIRLLKKVGIKVPLLLFEPFLFRKKFKLSPIFSDRNSSILEENRAELKVWV